MKPYITSFSIFILSVTIALFTFAYTEIELPHSPKAHTKKAKNIIFFIGD